VIRYTLHFNAKFVLLIDSRMSSENKPPSEESLTPEERGKFAAAQNSLDFHRSHLTSSRPHPPPRPVQVPEETSSIPGRGELNQANANANTGHHVVWNENLVTTISSSIEHQQQLEDSSLSSVMTSNNENKDLIDDRIPAVDNVAINEGSKAPQPKSSPDQSNANINNDGSVPKVPISNIDEDLMKLLPSPPTSPPEMSSLPSIQVTQHEENNEGHRGVGDLQEILMPTNPRQLYKEEIHTEQKNGVTTVFRYVKRNINKVLKTGDIKVKEESKNAKAASKGDDVESSNDLVSIFTSPNPEEENSTCPLKGVRFEEEYDPALFASATEIGGAIKESGILSHGALLCKKASDLLHTLNIKGSTGFEPSSEVVTAFDLEYEKTKNNKDGNNKKTLSEFFIESAPASTDIYTEGYNDNDSNDEQPNEPEERPQVPLFYRDEAPVHDAAYYISVLPPEYHPFLRRVGSKKDCRVWMWKNAEGKAAREAIREKQKKG